MEPKAHKVRQQPIWKISSVIERGFLIHNTFYIRKYIAYLASIF